MIKSCVTISLVKQAQNGPFVFHGNLDESCRKASELGFDAVEIFVPNAESVDPKELANILDACHLRLAAMGTGAGYLLHKLHLSSPNASIRDRAFKFIKAVIDLAGSLGGMAIIGSMKGVLEEGAEKEQVLGWLKEALTELAKRSARHGVALVLEPLNRYETNFINTLAEGAELIETLEADNVKLLADTFHMNIEERSICESLRKAARHIAHVHFADSNRRAAGCGHLDFSAIVETLHEIKYNGYLSAEALPYPTSEGAARQTMRCFQEHGLKTCLLGKE